MRHHRPTLIGAFLGVTLTLAACSSQPSVPAAQPSPSTAAPAPPQTTAATAPTPSSSDTTAAAVRALQIASRAVPHGRAYDLDREHHSGHLVWSVEVAGAGDHQFILAVTADGTRLLARRQSPHPDLDDLQEARAARISAPQAVRLATQHHPGATR